MTTAIELDEKIDLNRHYTAEERDAIFVAMAEACGEGRITGDYTEADRILRHLPIHPRWAKIIAEVMGKKYLLERFNVTHANEVYGEGWLDEI